MTSETILNMPIGGALLWWVDGAKWWYVYKRGAQRGMWRCVASNNLLGERFPTTTDTLVVQSEFCHSLCSLPEARKAYLAAMTLENWQ